MCAGSLPAHIEFVRGSIESALSDPAGHGVGSIAISGGEYGGVVGGTEGDPGRAPFAAGLVAYLAAVVALRLTGAYRLAPTLRDAALLAALRIVVITFLQWLNRDNYAVVFWAWLRWVGSARPRREDRPSVMPARGRR